MEVLTRLSAEHETLRTLLEGIASAADAQDSAALTSRLETARAALTDDLDAHIAVEEAEAFAAISQTLGEDLVLPFCEEHVEIRALRDEIYERLARGEAPYGSSLRLCDLILAHQQREDMMLFPSAREALVQ